MKTSCYISPHSIANNKLNRSLTRNQNQTENNGYFMSVGSKQKDKKVTNVYRDTARHVTYTGDHGGVCIVPVMSTCLLVCIATRTYVWCPCFDGNI